MGQDVPALNCLDADPFSSTDFFPNKLNADNLDSARFSVTYHNTYKTIRNIALDENYILYCTREAPEIQGIQSKTFIQIPVQSFAIMDMRSLGFLDLLGQSNNVTFVSNSNNVTSPCRTAGSASTGTIESVENTNYGLAIYPGTVSNNPKGVGFGIGYDNSPLGNAQWIKYFAAFTNQERLAESIYNTIRDNYQSYQVGLRSSHISYKRNLTVIDYDASNDRYYIFQDRYFQNLTQDAGATLLTPLVQQPGHPATMRDQLQNSSLVIDFSPMTAFDNGGYDNWLQWLQYDPELTRLGEETALSMYKSSKQYINNVNAPPFIRNRQLWRLDYLSNRGAIDFWTRGLARPDLMLKDLIQSQFPDFFQNQEWSFMRNYAENSANEVMTLGMTNPELYECQVNPENRARITDGYENLSSDAPSAALSEAQHKSLSLAVTVAASVIGGMIGLSCLVTIAILLGRKYKNREGQRFTRLKEVPDSPIMADNTVTHSSKTIKTITTITKE
ncbi:hypothetical protein BDB01DRAFT_807142 [Pilobolus umbonatus]|nr:hypothetical protein BDB01DRAFT_807142 [Pilobolus umbonatus]